MQYSQEKTCVELLNKVAVCTAWNFIKNNTPAQMFSCKYYEISKITFFEEHLHKAASEVTLGCDCSVLFSGQSLSKACRLSNITKILVAFKPEL